MGVCIVALCNKEGLTNVAALCPTIGAADCTPNGQEYKILICEIWATFVFVSVNVNIIYENGSKELIPNALIIGLTLTTALSCAAKLSGASVNPAVGLV